MSKPMPLEYFRTRYAERKAAGLCPRCGGERADKAKAICEHCRGLQARTGPPRPRKMPPQTSQRWIELNALMTNSCPRCGLRGPHDCIPTHTDPWDRRGPGRVYPEGG
jgi:Zn finger protein HypA/HybF involved in hydrogenase expression